MKIIFDSDLVKVREALDTAICQLDGRDDVCDQSYVQEMKEALEILYYLQDSI